MDVTAVDGTPCVDFNRCRFEYFVSCSVRLQQRVDGSMCHICQALRKALCTLGPITTCNWQCAPVPPRTPTQTPGNKALGSYGASFCIIGNVSTV